MAIKLILALLLVTTSHGRPIPLERTMDVVTGSNSAAVEERPKPDVINKYSRKRRFQAFDELNAVIAGLQAIDITGQRQKPKADSSILIKVDKNVNVNVVHHDSTKNSQQQGLQADDHQSVHIQHDSPPRASISLNLEHKQPSDGQADDHQSVHIQQDSPQKATISLNLEHKQPSDGQADDHQSIRIKQDSPQKATISLNLEHKQPSDGQADDHQSIRIQQDSPQKATISLNLEHKQPSDGQADDHQSIRIQQDSPQKATISLSLEHKQPSDGQQQAADDEHLPPVTSKGSTKPKNFGAPRTFYRDINTTSRVVGDKCECVGCKNKNSFICAEKYASGKYPKGHFLHRELDALIARLEDINIKQNNPKVEIKVDKNVKVHVVHQGSTKDSQGLQADDHQSVHIQQGSPQEAMISLNLEHKHPSDEQADNHQSVHIQQDGPHEGTISLNLEHKHPSDDQAGSHQSVHIQQDGLQEGTISLNLEHKHPSDDQAGNHQSVHIQQDGSQEGTISLKLEHKQPSDGQQLAADELKDVSGKYRQEQIYDELDANIARLKDIDNKRNNLKAEGPVVIKVDKDVDIHVVHKGPTENSQGLQADDLQSVHIQQGSPQRATISLKLQNTHSSDEQQLASADDSQQPVTSEDVSGKYPQKRPYDELDAIIARLETNNFKRKHPNAVEIKVDKHVDIHVANGGSTKNSQQQGLQADDHQSVHIQQGSPQRATISLKLENKHPSDGQADDHQSVHIQQGSPQRATISLKLENKHPSDGQADDHQSVHIQQDSPQEAMVSLKLQSENKDESNGDSEDEDEYSDDDGGFSDDEVSDDEAKVSETGYDLYNTYYIEHDYRILDTLRNGIQGYFGLIKSAIEDNRA